MPILEKKVPPEALFEIMVSLSMSGINVASADVVANKVTCVDLSKDDVHKIVEGLEQRFPFFSIGRTESERFKGIVFKGGQKGSCSVVHSGQSADKDQFFHGDQCIASLAHADVDNYQAAMQKLQKIADDEKVPFLTVGYGHNLKSCLPFFIKAVNE